MCSNNNFRGFTSVIALSLLLGLLFSCTSKEKYAGMYRAEQTRHDKQVELFIDLKENGEGIWRAGEQEVPFSWYIKGEELRLHTKEGGVIVGKIQAGSLQIALPGSKILVFKKSG